MATVSTYLNFTDTTEKAFTFYKEVFRTEFMGEIHRFSEVPLVEGQTPLSDHEKNLIMNVTLPILGGHMLMGTDAPASMRSGIVQGNNVMICLDPESREETKRLYQELSEGGRVEQELQDMFWGALYGTCTDKFGIQWMFNTYSKE